MDQSVYWQAIQDKICKKCIDGDGHGNCRLDPSRECALQLYLPLITNAVGTITSTQIDEYVRELRTVVCAQCQYQAGNGTCLVRTEVNCALDRYFPLIVEAIEEVNQAGKR